MKKKITCDSCNAKFFKQVGLAMHLYWGCPEKIINDHRCGMTFNDLCEKYYARKPKKIEEIISMDNTPKSENGPKLEWDCLNNICYLKMENGRVFGYVTPINEIVYRVTIDYKGEILGYEGEDAIFIGEQNARDWLEKKAKFILRAEIK